MAFMLKFGLQMLKLIQYLLIFLNICKDLNDSLTQSIRFILQIQMQSFNMVRTLNIATNQYAITMELIKEYHIKSLGVVIASHNESKLDLTKGIKLTSKAPQNARNIMAKMDEQFMYIARIEGKKEKKNKFFNRCKASKNL